MIEAVQTDIFDFLDLDYKTERVAEVLDTIEQHMPGVEVAAVWVPNKNQGGAFPGFALKVDGMYKIYEFWHGKLNQNHFTIKQELPNRDWIEIN